MNTVPKALLDFIDRYEHFIVASHREPDGDCVGSSLALASYLARKGKRTSLVSAGPFKRPEIREFEPLFAPNAEQAERSEGTALFVLDCSGIERLGDAAAAVSDLPRAVVDHHATNESSGPADYVVGTAPSTTVLVQDIMEASGDGPTREEAELLLFGLCTDTGFFRHLDERSASTFEHASRLVAAGANPKKTFARMNGGKSFESRVLISRILSRMTRYYDGRLVVSSETIDDTREYGLEGRDSDSLYQLIQAIRGVEAIVIVRQESETTCSVGLRSLDRVDVSVVATAFGGGGHRQASGLNTPGTIEELIPRFVEAFKPQFS